MRRRDRWWLSDGDQVIGPHPTDLILRGIDAGKIANNVFVCAVGSSTWCRIQDVPCFEASFRRGDGPAAEGIAERASIQAARAILDALRNRKSLDGKRDVVIRFQGTAAEPTLTNVGKLGRRSDPKEE